MELFYEYEKYDGGDVSLGDDSVIGKSSSHSHFLVPLRLVAILETNKLQPLSFSFMKNR